jgi:uncharacterized membrane protein
MGEVLFAGIVLLATHLGVSSTPLRGALVRLLGERGYLAAYSLVAAAALAFLILAYADVPRLEYLWVPDPRLYWVPKIAMMIALVMLVGGFMVRNPTAVGQGGALEAPATGMTRITRHPFQWAVVLWAASHIVANGDQVSVAFFGALLVLALAGSVLIDAKKSRLSGWDAFAAQTSNVPFLAILTGRNRLVPRELALPTVVGAIVYAAVFWSHEWLAGVPVFW